MAKDKVVFICKECGFESPRWMGNCTSCGSWNSFEEQIKRKELAESGRAKSISMREPPRPVKLSEIQLKDETRQKTGIGELDRVLGGGLMPGSFVLLGGDPGIGKSTLMLQMAQALAPKSILYCAGEESPGQIKQRSSRLELELDHLRILPEVDIQRIIDFARKLRPDLLIVDSIQTVYRSELSSMPGTVSQIRECSALLMQVAKQEGISVFAIGHVTKQGDLAGPRILEHMVDTVLQFEGDNMYQLRLLRALKNRFGATNELGVFEMEKGGLREVNSPSALFLPDHSEPVAGSALTCTLEGSRPIVLEIQALVGEAHYGLPQRSANGFDQKRLNMLIAVIEKRMGIDLGKKDVFVNVAGGLKVKDPAVDLAVVAAILSSFRDASLQPRYVFLGEVGLNAEVRTTAFMAERLNELSKLGLDKVWLPKVGKRDEGLSLEMEEIADIRQLVRALQS